MFIYENDRFGGKREGQAKRTGGQWRGVSVVVTGRCCQQAQDLAGKRFLTAEAPLFPLRGCQQADCDCRYQHFDDRRVRARRTDERLGMARRRTDERRQAASRRSNDASA